MPRAMSSAMKTAFAATLLTPVFFVEAHFNGVIARMWTGIGSVTWSGHTWLGLGSLMRLSVIEDGNNVEARGIQIVLSGLDSTLLGDALTEFQLGLPAIVYVGLYSGGSLIADPITSWAGRMDQPTIDVSGDTATISIACESRLIDMNVPADRRWTNEDAQLDTPGDLAFSFVDSIQEMTLFWGHFPTSTNNL